jgi:uncharacterized protein (TIGR02466 family)
METPFTFPILTLDLPNGEEIAEEVRTFAFAIRERDTEGGLISQEFGTRKKNPEDYAKYGYTSFTNYNLAATRAIPMMHEAACVGFQEYFSRIGAHHHFYIDTSWVATYDKECYVPEHTHPNAHLSMVFYANAEEGTGQIIFKNPALPIYQQMSERSAQMWNDTWEIPPKIGRMIVFPSFMPHRTRPHMGEQERVIFSCNACITNSMVSRYKPSIDQSDKGKAISSLEDDKLLFPDHNGQKELVDAREES